MFRKETEYALRGLVYIQVQNYKDRRPGIAEIAEEIDAPQYYTAKIMQRLVKQGFVRSIKGKGGGFYFSTDEPDLILKEIVKEIVSLYLRLVVRMPCSVRRVIEFCGLIKFLVTEPALFNHVPVVWLVKYKMGAGSEHPLEGTLLDQRARCLGPVAEQDKASIICRLPM